MSAPPVRSPLFPTDDPLIAAAAAASLAFGRHVARLLGYPYAPGDLVIDTVTGELARVIHVSRRAIRRPAPQSSAR